MFTVHALHRPLSAIAVALALGAAVSPVLAQTQDDNSFAGMTTMPRMDANKDGMVSKKEFLDTMGRMWDMKAKQMNVKGDKMSSEDFKQIMMYLKAGG